MLLLQNLVEKVMILLRAVDSYCQGPGELGNEAMNARLTEYAELLASQGSLSTAFTYLGAASSHVSARLPGLPLYCLHTYLGAASSHVSAPLSGFSLVFASQGSL